MVLTPRRVSPTRPAYGIALALAGFLAALAAAPAAGAGIFDPTTFTLSNGMQVVVIENHRVPIVNHMVWYKVGAADEPPGKSGIAHFLEHLMFKGTETVPPGADRVVDPTKESQRIRETQALGRPITEGQTPIIERRKKKGLLEGIF